MTTLEDVARLLGEVKTHPSHANSFVATCPFGDHGYEVDVSEMMLRSLGRMDRVGTVKPLWAVAFEIRPNAGTFCCFGCGEHGSLDDLARRLGADDE